MWRLRLARAEVVFCLTVSLGVTGNALAQGRPGYRMRMPVGPGVAAPIGASPRVPRLIGSPDGTLDRRSDPFGRRFVPFDNFGWYLFGFDSDGYREDSTGESYRDDSRGEAHSVGQEPARDVYPVHDSVPEIGPLEVTSRSVASGIIVRLTWRDQGVAAEQVAFFLADSAKSVLSAQTDRSPPFTVQLQLPSGTAFAGMTVVLPGGNLVTRFVSYRGR